VVVPEKDLLGNPFCWGQVSFCFTEARVEVMTMQIQIIQSAVDHGQWITAPEPKGPPAPSGPTRPKRGAIPTPKEDIDRARPYVPDADQPVEHPEPMPTPPPKVDEKKPG
jgi:hypothetical protein